MLIQLSLSQWGLLLDIIGALLLFRFGLPSNIWDPKGPALAIGLTEEEERIAHRHNKKIKFGAYTGVFLLLAGFVLQFIGSFK